MSICCSDIIHHFQHSSTYIYESIYTRAFIFLLLSCFVHFSPVLEAVSVPQGAAVSWIHRKNHKDRGGQKIPAKQNNKNTRSPLQQLIFQNAC